MPPKKPAAPTPVETILHNAATRPNIPTHELRDFAAPYEATPTVAHYPRDPALDPQLVWKGKDEQDSRDLAVEVVPIYIQEKVHPQALVRDLLAHSDGDSQLDLFADYDALADFGDKVEFYQHDEKWQNRLILGDSLLVMNSLAEKEGLKGKVQMIYLDPPYGIKFGSNWQVSTRKRDVKDGKAEDATRQPEQVRAFRDTWQLGIHSYLSYLRDRLTVARELLTETGSIFVQIGDENVHLVRSLMDEVFGAENFVSLVTVQKTGQKSSVTIDAVADYVLWYASDISRLKYRQLYKREAFSSLIHSDYRFLEQSDGVRRPLSLDERLGRVPLPDGARPYGSVSLHSQDATENTKSPVRIGGREYHCPPNRHWSNEPSTIEKAALCGLVEVQGNTPRRVTFYDHTPGTAVTSLWADTMGADDPVYVVQTATKVIERCLLMTTDPGDLVLDPTCGSGTTAYVAERWGRRWITIDTSRVALALARTRLMAAKYPYYLLADSPEGVSKESNISGIATPPPQYRLPIRYPQGLRLQACAPRHARVHCQQRRD